MDQVLGQIEVFCKAFSNLELILNFDSESLSNSVSKYMGKNECLVKIRLPGEVIDWDILENNNPEEFALIYSRDTRGTAEQFISIEQSVRLQIQSFVYKKYKHAVRVLKRFEGKQTTSGPSNMDSSEGTIEL